MASLHRHLKQEGDGSALVSFSLKDEPVTVEVSEQKSKEQPLILSVVTANGSLQVFEHILNGPKKIPLKPKVTVDINTGTENNEKPLEIIAAQAYDDGNKPNLLLCYGNTLKPTFEKLSYSKCDNHTVLKREDSVRKANASIIDHVNNKIAEPLQPKDAKIVGPAQLAPVRPSDSSKSPKKVTETPTPAKKLKGLETSLSNIEFTGSVPPKADSVVQLLVQGLASDDRRMLDTALHRDDEILIRNTINKLPLEFVPKLLGELQKSLFHKGDNTVYMRWLETLFQNKLSFILTVRLYK